MPSDTSTVLRARFENGSPLTGTDQRLIDGLPFSSRNLRRSEVISRQGDPANRLHVIERGSAVAYRYLEDGSRQVVDLYFPGEILELNEFSERCYSSGLMALTDTRLVSYDKADVSRLFYQSPELSRRFINLLSHQQAVLTERLLTLSRAPARRRVAHFLLEIRSRATPGTVNSAYLFGRGPREIQPGRQRLEPVDTVRIPQAVIADALGLSLVHVNRTLRQLRENGVVGSTGHGITLIDIPGLKAEACQADSPGAETRKSA